MPKNPHADFSPVLDGYSGIGAFRFWCQTALPLTYDDSLSYYELLNKVVNYLNHTIEDLTAVESNTSALANAYNQLQKYVNDYFDDLDVEAELRNILDTMAEDGSLDAILDPLVENQLPGVVDEKIDAVVAEQIDGAVAGQIDESVSDQLPALVDAGIPGEVSEWLEEKVDPVGSAVIVDSSLTIGGAAADAKATGDELSNLKTQINYFDGGFKKFHVNANATHSSTTDKISVDIKTGEEFVITFKRNYTNAIQLYAYDSNNTSLGLLWSSYEKSGYRIFSASDDIASIGMTVSSGTSADDYIFTVSYGNSEFQNYKNADNISNLTAVSNSLEYALEDSSYLNFEIGTIINGTEQVSNANARTKGFTKADKFDKVVIAPVNDYNLYYTRIALYSSPNQSDYVSTVEIPTISNGRSYTYTFESDCYFRIKTTKAATTVTIDDTDISYFDTFFTFIGYYGKEEIKENADKISTLETRVDNNDKRLANNGLLEFVLGSIVDGVPQISNAYARTKEMRYANKGDILTLKSAYSIYYAGIYLYDAENVYSYTETITIPTTTAGNTYTYTFTRDCWFMIRATKAATAVTLNEDELYIFNNSFTFTHYINATEIIKNTSVMSKNYDELNESIENNFNIVVQTDTHVSAFTDYLSGTVYNKSDFDNFAAVARSINKIKADAFANLGDIVRGYQQDPDYETRSSIDKIMTVYDAVSTNKCFVIGNHDDGCLFYNNNLDDNKSTLQVLFPNEQFNRYTKYGENNKNTKNYYYTDINGIRIITLYQRDFDYSLSIPDIESFKIGATQIDWFVNTALNTNSPVIVLCHAPLVSSLYATGGTGFSEIVSALETFVSNGGEVIAVLAGHTHAQNADKINGINYIVFKNGYTFFEIVSVDTTNKTITCIPVNTSTLTERTFTY